MANMEHYFTCLQVTLLTSLLLKNCHALPIVDPGVFIIQGIVSCHNGSGYCMLGNDCTADIDFMATNEEGQHCDGLHDAFTPAVPFTCCLYNERGKASSIAPTTEISDFTITGDDLLLQEIPILEHQDTNEIPEGVDLSSLIDIIGVVTDMTGVLGLITQPYTRPEHVTGATVFTTTTTTPPPDGILMQSNSSHASISLVGILSQLHATTSAPLTTTSALVPTTSVPLLTTSAPLPTTSMPQRTTIVPLQTTRASQSTESGPLQTTSMPGPTTSIPLPTTSLPDSG